MGPLETVSAKGFSRAGHTPSLVASLLHFDVSFMVWVLLGALGAYVSADLDLTPAQKGLTVAVPPLGGCGFRLIIGSIVERIGIKRTGPAAMGLTFLPLVWGWVGGGTYAEVLGIGLLLGVAGASFAVALPLVSCLYPPEFQGMALGKAGAGNSGTIIAISLFYLVTFGGFVGLSGYLSIFFVDRFDISKLSAAGYAALCAGAGSLLRPPRRGRWPTASGAPGC